MSHSRREFIKFVVAGSVASGCPVDYRSDPRAGFQARLARRASMANISKSATRSAMATISNALTPPRKPTS